MAALGMERELERLEGESKGDWIWKMREEIRMHVFPTEPCFLLRLARS